MPVKCRLLDKDLNKVGETINHICFGFLYLFRDTHLKAGISKEVLMQEVKYLEYYPDQYSAARERVSPRTAQIYLDLLLEIGITKVLTAVSGWTAEKIKAGVRVDLSTMSGQAAVGAMELVRNIDKHPRFVIAVVKLYEDGVAPEVALFIPRFFRYEESAFPKADTTAYGMPGFKINGERLFSSTTFEERNKKYRPWKETGDFRGVYKLYEGTAPVPITSAMYPYLMGRYSYDNTAYIKEGGYAAVQIQLEHIYPAKKCSYERLLEFCREYQHNYHETTGDNA